MLTFLAACILATVLLIFFPSFVEGVGLVFGFLLNVAFKLSVILLSIVITLIIVGILALL